MTELQFFERLKKRFPDNEYALIPQVRNRTGFSTRVRTADAVALSLWPSRGIALEGFEFKDSRGDWLKEMADPAKSEEIGRFCAFWWLVISDKKICPVEEVPLNWGLLCVKDDSVSCLKKAPRRDFEKPTWEFVAAVMRAAAGAVTGEDEVKRRVESAVNKANEGRYEAIRQAEVKAREEITRNNGRALKAIKDFEAASGVDIESWNLGGVKRIGEAVKFVVDGGFDDLLKKLMMVGRDVTQIRTSAVEVLNEISPEDSCVI